MSSVAIETKSDNSKKRKKKCNLKWYNLNGRIQTEHNGVIYLLTTRFNNDTYQQHRDIIKKYKYEYKSLQKSVGMKDMKDIKDMTDMNDRTIEDDFKGCIYGSSKTIQEHIPLKALTIVFEMNNSSNTITGVGYVYNRPYTRKRFKIYEDNFYNRITYIAKLHIDRGSFSPTQLDIIQQMEAFLFYGKGHLKRGQGFTSIPDKYLNKEFKEKIMKEFIIPYSCILFDIDKE